MQGGNRQPLIVADERFFKQALETVEENDCSVGDTVDAFNKRVNKSGISPTVTTRPEGFKTAILPVVEPLAYDEQNGYIRKDGTVGTLTTDGSSPKHNNRVIENCYVSEKGVKYICDPKRGMATDVNAEISQPLTAKGQSNWTGSFISPDIESLEKSSTIGGNEPTKINLKNGEQITSNDNLSKLRIRKLTPKECWRLMGFDDADFEKASQYNSNSQLYKQAGNSIVVDVLYYIFRQMI
jgi:site-specific DNA-cytosine methylase